MVNDIIKKNYPESILNIIDSDKFIELNIKLMRVSDNVRNFIEERASHHSLRHQRLPKIIPMYYDNSQSKSVIRYALESLRLDNGGYVERMKKLEDLRALKGMFKKPSISNTIKLKVYFSSTADWTPGTFGNPTQGSHEGDSCFWGGRSTARKMLEMNGGIAVKMYKETDEPFCRFWMAPDGNGNFVIFNYYSTDSKLLAFDYDLWGIGKFLADALNMKAFPTYLLNKGTSSGTLYINNGYGLLLKQRGNKVKWYDRKVINLNWSKEDIVMCTKCNEPVYIREAVDDVNGYLWCEDCADDNLEVCFYSGNLYIRDSMVTGPDGNLYGNNVISQIPEFVYDVLDNIFIFKEDAKEISTGKWTHVKHDVSICKHCGALLTDKDVCDDCDFVIKLKEKSEEMGILSENGRDIVFIVDSNRNDYDTFMQFFDFASNLMENYNG